MGKHHAAKAWERLESCLTVQALFLALYNDRTKWELTGYWHPLRALGEDLGRDYTQADHAEHKLSILKSS